MKLTAATPCWRVNPNLDVETCGIGVASEGGECFTTQAEAKADAAAKLTALAATLDAQAAEVRDRAGRYELP